MFWERFYDLCQKNNTTPNAICSKLNLSTATATHWKNGSIPKIDTLMKIAEILNTTVAYLMGNSDSVSAPLVEKDEIIFNRNGEVIRKKFTKEQMDYLEKFIHTISGEDSPDF